MHSVQVTKDAMPSTARPLHLSSRYPEPSASQYEPDERPVSIILILRENCSSRPAGRGHLLHKAPHPAHAATMPVARGGPERNPTRASRILGGRDSAWLTGTAPGCRVTARWHSVAEWQARGRVVSAWCMHSGWQLHGHRRRKITLQRDTSTCHSS